MEVEYVVEVMAMIEKIVRKFELGDRTPEREDREYWLSRPPEERAAAVDALRRQFYGRLSRIPRTVQKLEPSWR
ncbi:MAG: hypothetical protein WD009_00275 [Phycisphaeraceae bacterium]